MADKNIFELDGVYKDFSGVDRVVIAIRGDFMWCVRKYEEFPNDAYVYKTDGTAISLGPEYAYNLVPPALLVTDAEVEAAKRAFWDGPPHEPFHETMIRSLEAAAHVRRGE
jgi:hypothetical protein